MITSIEINSVARTDVSGLTYDATLAKTPKKLSFAIKGPKTVPQVGDEVYIENNGNPFFRGSIVARAEETQGMGVPSYRFTCHDGFYTMNSRLVIKAYSSQTLEDIAQDIVDNFMTGFTLSVTAGSPVIRTARFNYEQPTSCIRKLCESVGWDWYVDASSVIHIVPPSEMAAPYPVDEVSGYCIPSSVRYDRDITQLRNVVYVRGGEYDNPIAEGDAVDRYESNGTDDTFPLVYRYSNVELTVNGTPQTVGIDYINEPTDFDCLYNFQEKLVRFPAGTLASGDIVRVFGDAKVPLIIQAEDIVSVEAYGVREGVEINRSIDSIEEAETLAGARLEQWREGSKEGSFQSYEDGWEVGQTVEINIPTLGLVGSYKINRVRATMHTHTALKYTVEFIKSGQTTLTDMLIGLIGQTRNNVTIADNEVIQRLKTLTDQFGISDELVDIIKTSGPYAFTPVTTKTASKFNFSTFT